MVKLTNIFLISIFFNSSSICTAQKQILRINHKAKSELYFIDVSLQDDSATMASEMILDQASIEVRLDTTDSFLLSDSLAIQNISKQWKGKLTNDMYLCWYDYFIYVVENGVIKDEIRVNEKCKQAVSYNGIFDFENLPLKTDTLKNKIVRADIEFNSNEIGRNFINELKSAGGYHIPNIGYWYDHDGWFDVRLPSKKNWKESDLDELKRKINKEYSNADYSLRYNGTYGGYSHVTVDCPENFYNIFNLYSKSEKWRNHSLTPILVFGRKDAKLKQLIQKYDH